MKIGETIGSKYEIVKKIGRGGNGIVYEVKDTSNNDAKYALKLITLRLNIFYHKHIKPHENRERIKYERFKEEIKVVIDNQNDVEGILPILDYHIPDKPTDKNQPWYVMPIAQELRKATKDVGLEQMILHMGNFSKVLINLHKRGIAHRDIKPQNLYLHNGQSCISDFGLVYYPDRKDGLTQKGESVGPRNTNTIAPEMKFIPKESDPLAADVYSMGKTIWLMVTGSIKAFDGEYNHRSEHHSIGNFISGEYLVGLHEILTACTQEIPERRLTAIELNNELLEWIHANKSFEKRSEKEWDFIVREMIPYTPESITWNDTFQIMKVLKFVSKTATLNHLFIPSGGGQDLNDCKLSRTDGFIELDIGYVRKVKPKRLFLEVMGDYQWNYLYLETETVPVSGVYDYDDTSDVFDEPVVEVDDTKYIDPKYMSYGTFENEPIPEEAKEVLLGIKGNYVLFPKNSHYNLKMGSYDAYQTQHETPKKFKEFIIQSMEKVKWEKDNPLLVFLEQEEKKKAKAVEREKYRKKNEDEKEVLNSLINDYKVDMNIDSDFDKSGYLKYGVKIQIICGGNYYLKEEGGLGEDINGFSLSDLLAGGKSYVGKFYTSSFEVAQKYCCLIKAQLDSILIDFETVSNDSTVYIDLKRVKSPVCLFTKQEIYELLINGDDKLYNDLVITEEGKVCLLSSDNKFGNKVDCYPAKCESFDAYTNTVGNKLFIEKHLDDIYLLTLDTWLRHLQYGTRKGYSDYIRYNEEEFIKRIESEAKKYS